MDISIFRSSATREILITVEPSIEEFSTVRKLFSHFFIVYISHVDLNDRDRAEDYNDEEDERQEEPSSKEIRETRSR